MKPCQRRLQVERSRHSGVRTHNRWDAEHYAFESPQVMPWEVYAEGLGQADLAASQLAQIGRRGRVELL